MRGPSRDLSMWNGLTKTFGVAHSFTSRGSRNQSYRRRGYYVGSKQKVRPCLQGYVRLASSASLFIASRSLGSTEITPLASKMAR